MKLRPHPFNTRPPQQGIALVTVLVLLLLSLTAVLGALRYSNLNEAMLGNTSDYNRTFAAAEALVRDAEMDIVGRRTTAAVGQPFFPIGSKDMEDVETLVATNMPESTVRCWKGICMPLKATDLENFETNPVTLAAMKKDNVGAKYGEFTRIGLPAIDKNAVDVNRALHHDDSRYWIEAFRYGEEVFSGAVIVPEPEDKARFIYRITAIAQGSKPGTRVVIRSIFVPYPRNSNG